jgi:hypothetical protein
VTNAAKNRESRPRDPRPARTFGRGADLRESRAIITCAHITAVSTAQSDDYVLGGRDKYFRSRAETEVMFAGLELLARSDTAAN